MAAVTQLIPNFLGGVSKQNDDKKLTNQLTECINGYPDPTFGMIKRPGMKFISKLKKANGTTFTKAELQGAAWFFLDRSDSGSYIGAVKGNNIYVWTAEQGTWCTVTNNSASYLTGTGQDDYHFRSIQDTTVITNKLVTTAMVADPSPTANTVTTIKLRSVDVTEHSVIIQNEAAVFTPQATHTAQHMLSYDASDVQTSQHMIDAVKALIEAQHSASNSAFTGKWYLEGFKNSLVIRRTTESNGVVIVTDSTSTHPGNNVTYVPFTVKVTGGLLNENLEVFQDTVIDISKLPVESFHGRYVHVLNSAGANDDLYFEFVAYDGVRGPGYWKETAANDIGNSFVASTLPHRLIKNTATSFTFEPIPYAPRKAGNRSTNPNPSFVGKKITSTFFYNNRFGFLSEDNVFLGQSNNLFEFFAETVNVSAIRAPDPIDLNASSIRPVILTEVLPSPQGLLILSERQQFQLLTTDAQSMTSNNTTIRSLSNYEMATNIRPIDFGTTTAFVSTVPGYSKLFTLALQSQNLPPVVTDISKAVFEWIPDTVDEIAVSTPNSAVFLIDKGSSYIYIYKFYNNGKEDLFQAWTKWQIPTTIQNATVINDALLVVSQHEDEYTIGSIELDELPSGEAYATSSSYEGNIALDLTTRPVKPHASVDAVVYDAVNDLTKIYVPYTPINNKEAIMLLNIPIADKGTSEEIDAYQGYWTGATERIESGTNYTYLEVKGNFLEYADGIVVGYGYDLDVTLPKFYYQKKDGADYTASLTISKIKLSTGRSGAIRFKLKAKSADEWEDVQHTIQAGSYESNTNPVVPERIFVLPIHQRNTNFELKVTSNFPYPVSLVSMMWEGNYSPRFHRRT
jgi:hypothetical protein|tara:strand:- start:7749 stop:10304 length:2556 start_codon:yes stop_codon:yes gene_type:complete